MPPETLAKKLFALTSNIRYVAIYRGGELTLQARSRLPNASSGETDRYEELLVNPALITLTRQRGDMDCGGLEYLLVRYGHFYQLIFPLDDGHLSLAFEPQSNPLDLCAGGVSGAGGMSNRLSLARIEAATRVIDPVFLHTPQYRAESLEAQLGCRLVVKIETLNPIRSFKGRGASFYVAELPAGTALVCASAGNFGQAMAYACRARNVPLIVYASVNANPLKIERMRALGAEVRLAGEDFDAAKLQAKQFAAETGTRMVEDSLDVATGEGAGTMGVELLGWPEPFDAVLVALGNGAMITGIGRWVKAHAPHTQMIGVAASGAPAMVESWRSGAIVAHDRVDTISDGIAVRIPVPEAVADMRGTVDDVLLVSDDATLTAMRLLHQHLGIVVEPSGAVGVAALLEHRERFAGQLVATIICGGNLTPEQMRQWLG